MARIRLLATDLDGTLIGPANDFPLYREFQSRLEQLRAEHQCFWVACTGRSLGSFRSFFRPMQALGLEPDFVVVSHAYIFSLSPLGYVPHFWWSLRVRLNMWLHARRVRFILQEWDRQLIRMTLGCKTLLRRPDRMLLHFESEASARMGANLLRSRLGDLPNVQVFEYRNHVDVRPVPFTKGIALHELAGQLGVDTSMVLAIGNGHNDLSMLNGLVAGMVACPANSEPEVMDAVHRAEGHVASTAALAGVLESMEAFQRGTVNSALPGWWINPAERDGPDYNLRMRSEHRSGGCLSKGLLILLVIYTVLVVFARFGIVPLARWILAPLDLMIAWLARCFL